MHQTISGETHKKEVKIKIKGRPYLESFLKFDSQDYQNLTKYDVCLYDGKIINSPILNYINKNFDSKDMGKIKKLLINEYDQCEKMYPNLGKLFIKYYHEGFDQKTYRGFTFDKTNTKKFIQSLENEQIKQVAELIVSKFSAEYFVSVKNTKGTHVIVEKDKQNMFCAEYDFDYFERLNRPIKNYKYLIVDGVIDSVGEIHHVLYESSNNRDDYVIFCRGCHPEVKNTILKNNRSGVTNVYLVCFEINEDNINVLNDIAFLHNTFDIVSSQKGQTISQEVRKKLKLGNSIQFKRGKLEIENKCKEIDLINYRKKILERIEKADNEKNKEVLLNRYRNLQNKKLNIYIPDMLYENLEFMTELHYFLSFLSNIKNTFCKAKLEQKIVYIPIELIRFVKNKLNSFRKTINNIEYILFNLE